METQNIVNFIFELGQLKKERHSGMRLAGIKDPDSIAEHAWRATQIGFVIAVMEGANPEKVASMVVIHDNAKARIGDQTKIAANYYSKKEAQARAFSDQISLVEEGVGQRWQEYSLEYQKRESLESRVAHDAEKLELAFQAKEYLDTGYVSAQNWIDRIEQVLTTESAKEIMECLKNTKFTDWWNDLKIKTKSR